MESPLLPTVPPPVRARRFDARGRAAFRSLAARLAPAAVAAFLSLLLGGCADTRHQIVISVPEQRMLLLDKGQPMAVFPVSTSKFGTGDRAGTNQTPLVDGVLEFGIGDRAGTGQTPLGNLEIAAKIGDGAPIGAVLKSRRRTGEIVAVDAPGRDAIVTRILWLRGRESRNERAYDRFIYIHGTPEERNIGKPVSYGCVRMRSRDVVQLYDIVGAGARVFISDDACARAAAPLLAPGASLALLGPPPSTPLATARAYVPPTPTLGSSQGPVVVPPGGETFTPSQTSVR